MRRWANRTLLIDNGFAAAYSAPSVRCAARTRAFGPVYIERPDFERVICDPKKNCF